MSINGIWSIRLINMSIFISDPISTRDVYVFWMWINWYRNYQPAEPEYEVCWQVSEANESQTSYSVEQADIFRYQSYWHSDDMCIILKSNINTDTSIGFYICIFARKIMIQNIQNMLPQNIVHKKFANIPFVFTGLYKC